LIEGVPPVDEGVKRRLRDRFQARLAASLVTLERSLLDAQGGLDVSGEARPRNRGERAAVTSQGYLAGALNERIEALRQHLDLLSHVDLAPSERVRAGAMVLLASPDAGGNRTGVGVEPTGEPGEASWYILLPGGDGTRLEDLGSGPGAPVIVLSPTSPMGRALSGLSEGDVAVLQRSGREVGVRILEVG
jgi:hypothetical protein